MHTLSMVHVPRQLMVQVYLSALHPRYHVIHAYLAIILVMRMVVMVLPLMVHMPL
jgi:hypothetical protein